MRVWPFNAETYRRLHRGEKQLLLGHLRRLSEEDLYERFLTRVAGDDLMAHVNRDKPAHEAIGWFSKGMLRGVIEIFYGDDGAEAALSVERKWRGQGIGSELVRRALSFARDKGVTNLSILGRHGNYPLLAIAARFGAIEAVAGNHLVKGLLPIDGDYVSRFYFDLEDFAEDRQSGLLSRTFNYLRS
jgi:GNAT superfamily N-acetyltransferase